MKKLYKVKLGKPTGGGSSFVMYSSYQESKIKSEYFVVAKSFNEAGKLVMEYVAKILESEPQEVVKSPFGIETILAGGIMDVSTIELVSEELIFSENGVQK